MINHKHSVSLCFVSFLISVGVMGTKLSVMDLLPEQMATVDDFNDHNKTEIPDVVFTLVAPKNSPHPQNYDVNITGLVDQNFIRITNISSNVSSIAIGELIDKFSYNGNIVELTAVGIYRNLTGDLSATFSCSSDREDGICHNSVVSDPVKIYTEKKKLKISSTHHATMLPSFSYNVTVSVSKDLATLESLDVRVNLTSSYSKPGWVSTKVLKLGSPEGSKGTVLFTSIPTDVYNLSIECVSSSFCESLKPWIEFPQQNRVEAHESYQVLVRKVEEAHKLHQVLVQEAHELNQKVEYLEEANVNLMVCLKLKCGVHGNCTVNATACECETGWHGDHCDGVDINPTTTSTESPPTMITVTPIVSTTTSTVSKAKEDKTSPPTGASETKPAAASSSDAEVTTELEIPEHVLSTHIEVAVGVLIAVLILSLLGYLLYQYRVQVKEWVCSKKNVVSNLPRSLPRRIQRNSGGKYTKLPRTMQEALHQD